MADFNRNTIAGVQTGTLSIDEGLRAFMLRVYNYMAAGLGITGLVAYAVYALAVTTNQADAVAPPLPNGAMLTYFGQLIFVSPLKWVMLFAPLAVVFFLSARLPKMSVEAAQLTFWIYAALVGASIASIFLVYAHGSIARVFFITAATFGGLSLFGYTTKKDISGWGSFLFMGLIGIILASIVNIFVGSTGLQFAISVIGVLVFAGLTAYDTQQIKEEYYAGDTTLVAGQKAIMGALRLYLDFLNMFLMLLSLFGNRE
ncbi:MULTISPECIES: Bax inhibitor-1/YccA family protein [Rhodomicrobium]|uniref:Bax inhibitor-1/YccA family protein n=1 Tax=Rhodomicrobium TaxID=1068 RepID=UPI000B4B1047|nr:MULTISPECIES: Bax inhibitor-1/YccA family protein [Rhodomicrobium]